jgi:hypothetical protein
MNIHNSIDQDPFNYPLVKHNKMQRREKASSTTALYTLMKNTKVDWKNFKKKSLRRLSALG